MSGAVERIEAALGAMEAAAKAAIPPRFDMPDASKAVGDWTYDGNPSGFVGERNGAGISASTYASGDDGGRVARHIAMHNPAAVLERVAKLRTLVALHRGDHQCPETNIDYPEVRWFYDGEDCATLAALGDALDP